MFSLDSVSGTCIIYLYYDKKHYEKTSDKRIIRTS